MKIGSKTMMNSNPKLENNAASIHQLLEELQNQFSVLENQVKSELQRFAL